MANFISRYGDGGSVGAENMETIFSALLAELKTEKFDEPDDEHTQVSVGNEHWSVTAQVSGLITFDNLDMLEGTETDLPENMYLRDISEAALKSIWRAVVEEDATALKTFPWTSFEDLSPYRRDFYRK